MNDRMDLVATASPGLAAAATTSRGHPLSAASGHPITLIGGEGLRARGINYSRSHLWRLEQQDRFPRRVHVGKGRVAWIAHEVDDYLARLAANR